MLCALAAAKVTTFGYDAAGNRTTAIQPNGVTTTWTYDIRSRVTRIEHRKTGATLPLAQFDYTFNAQGLRSKQKFLTPDRGGSTCETTYTYDELGRLTESAVANVANCPFFSLSHRYTYDAVGNRLTESEPVNGTPKASTFTYDANDRLVEVKDAALVKIFEYGYDAAGNVIRKTTPKPANTGNDFPPQVTEYRWDAEGRLAGMTAPDAHLYTYLYDAEGQLVRQVDGTDPATQAVTYYLADKNLAFSQILEERDGAGALKVGYQYVETKPLKQVRGTTSSYYLADHLSTRILTDGNGNAQNVYTYRPYGEIERVTGSGPGDTPAVANSVLFAGERLDSNLVLYYLRARHYDPRTGRFASADSWRGDPRDPRSLHDYLYAYADPVDLRDPSGQFISLSGLGQTVALWAAPVLYIGQHAAARVIPFAASLGAQLNTWGNGLYRYAGYPNLRIAAGQAWEGLLNPAMRLLGGQPQRAIAGARPDWIFGQAHIVDAKLGQAISTGQLQAFINYAKDLGGRITYVTLTKPPVELADKVVKLGEQQGVAVKIIYVLPF